MTSLTFLTTVSAFPHKIFPGLIRHSRGKRPQYAKSTGIGLYLVHQLYQDGLSVAVSSEVVELVTITFSESMADLRTLMALSQSSSVW